MVLFSTAISSASDWPMWRCDPGRGASTAEQLPAELHLQWVLELPKPKACWPWTQYLIQFDASYEPVVAGKTLFVPSMTEDNVTAFDTDTGAQRWRFYADGPVRFAPVVWHGKVFFASDDGCLYCVDADTGKQRWKFRGAPTARKVLGNERLISMWPARGAPVVYDGKVYFAASIWPFMGTFIYALDADTGKVEWRNTGSGQVYVIQPHHSPAFAGVAPQGYMVATEDALVMPSGRSVPGAYDRRTGKLLYYRMVGKVGSFDVFARKQWYLNWGYMYNLADGAQTIRIRMPQMAVLTDDAIIGADGKGRVVAYALRKPAVFKVSRTDRRGNVRQSSVRMPFGLWQMKPEPKIDRVFIQAGSRIYVGGADGLVAAIDAPKNVKPQAPTQRAAKPGLSLIAKGSQWRYLAGANPKGDWTKVRYDASGWKTGKAGFGYGDGDDATVLADMRGNYTTVYIRKQFNIAKRARIPSNTALTINYDDAFIAYLDGKEVLRVGVGKGSGASATKIGGHEARGFQTFPIKNIAHLLHPGANVLAIEGHNCGAGSSDFSLDPYLAVPAKQPSPKLALPTVEAKVGWQTHVGGKPWDMIAADGKLFVVTKEGRIYCFGGQQAKARTLRLSPTQPKPDAWTERARDILARTKATAGYAIVFGLGTGRLAEELARQSDLHVIGFDPDAGKIDRLRRKLTAAGLYGQRVALLRGDAAGAELPPYLASLVASEDLEAAGIGAGKKFAERVFHVLRPYGGAACLRLDDSQRAALRRQVDALPNAKVSAAGPYTLLTRAGALPGSGSWTHQYGDVANSICSRDSLVRAPLGLLWFGGPSHRDVLPRHGHGPPEQVIGGRLFIEGIKVLSARDVYTGRTLWRKELPKLDTFDMYYNKFYNPDPYDRSYNQRHMPGANQYGTNFVATADRVYVAMGKRCLALDPATGKTLAEFKLPPLGRVAEPYWGYIGVYEDLLVAGAEPLHLSRDAVVENNRFGRGSKFIVVMDRHSGSVKWTRQAAYNFRHNCIVAGKGKLFCIDGMSKRRSDFLRRRGRLPKAKPRVIALDIRTGRDAWSDAKTVFGTWLGYSAEFDILLQAGSRAGDRARDEAPSGMAAYRGADGKLLWKTDARYAGPPIIHHELVITQTGGGTTAASPAPVFDLRTGELATRKHPLTGETIPWNWVRFKGCNTAIASEHLLTFRSSCASFVDLTSGQGTANLGGFKSGCTSNLVVADGVLNAPDYTRTCTCAFPNQTSLALVHMPDAEAWSLDYYPSPDKPKPVLRVGLNFGAAGNRFAPDGTLWIECPSVGGPSPDIPVRAEPQAPPFIRRHSSSVSGPLDWVASSAMQGMKALAIRPFLQPAPHGKKAGAVQAFTRHAGTTQLASDAAPVGSYAKPQAFTVRLYFAELEGCKPGERVFDVTIQGRPALERFDIAAAAGGANRSVVREFRGVEVRDDLRLGFRPAAGARARPTLSGVELIAEK